MTPHRQTERAFTLIELLVVVAIIGLLASVVLTSLSGSRAKARDSIRQQSLRQIQTALELYYATNAAYPSTGGQWYGSEPGDFASNNGGNWIPGLAPAYMGSLPRDPAGWSSSNPVCAGGWKMAYLYLSDGTNYKLLSHCAPESTWTSSNSFYDPVRPTWAWQICNTPTSCASW